MQLTDERHGQDLLLRVAEPRLDAAVAVDFKDEVRRRTAGHDGRVVLDLSAVEFLDSSGLGAVVAAMKELGRGRLELAGLHGAVEKVFRLTRMDSVFVVHTRAEDAFSPDRAAD